MRAELVADMRALRHQKLERAFQQLIDAGPPGSRGRATQPLLKLLRFDVRIKLMFADACLAMFGLCVPLLSGQSERTET